MFLVNCLLIIMTCVIQLKKFVLLF